jgi:hypothetical protein
MARKKTQLLEYWFRCRYGQAATIAVSAPPEPWVRPGYSEFPKPRRWSTVWDFNYDPVLYEKIAANLLRQRRETLKKWRQRKRGPAYIQYGKNGVVRYPLSALKAYRKLPHRNEFPEENPFFDEQGAAIILGVKPGTLKKWRAQNRGPAFRRREGNGRISYRLSVLMEFRAECTVEPQAPVEISSQR